jgi:hypothetical protein
MRKLSPESERIHPMDVPINVKVNCSDGPCGRTTRVILKPSTKEITHVVIDNDDPLAGKEYLVDVNRIMESDPTKVRLTLSQEELEQMPLFSATQFIPSELGGFTGVPYMMWPYYPAAAPVQVEGKPIPAGELVIRRGAKVNALEGPVGKVDEFLIDPANDQITHLIMREGHLWGKRDVTIPVEQIDHFKDDTVFLRLSRPDIEQLPTVPVRRNWKS